MTDATGVLRDKSLQLYEQYERLFAEGAGDEYKHPFHHFREMQRLLNRTV